MPTNRSALRVRVSPLVLTSTTHILLYEIVRYITCLKHERRVVVSIDRNPNYGKGNVKPMDLPYYKLSRYF